MTHLVLTHLGATFHVVEAPASAIDLVALHRPERAEEAFGDRLLAGTNAGIFHTPGRPVGLFVADGRERTPLETADGDGNFYLKPNGVFWIDATGPHVAPTEAYAPAAELRLATQSGPMLVSDGLLHPAFVERSENRKIRSGVGVGADDTVHLVVSEGDVSFWQLATLFRDVLGDCDALYLDGTISGLWGPGLPGGPADLEYSGLLVVLGP